MVAIVTEIPVADIVVNGNARKLDEAHVEELAKSMQENGLVVPIHVSIEDGRYCLKTGHHRLEASKRLGWDAINAVVEDPFKDDAERLMVQAVENTQRKDLTVVDKACIYASLVNDYGWRQVDVARRFNISQTDVCLALSLVNAHPKIQKAVEEGKLAPSAVEPIISQSIEIQDELADAVIQAKTVRRVKALVDAHLANKKLGKSVAKSSVGNPLDEFFFSEIGKAEEALNNASMAIPSDTVNTATLYRIEGLLQYIIKAVKEE